MKDSKRAIIVVGKMGHGKSAFVRMLACPEDKLCIKAEIGVKLVTTDFFIYKVNPTLGLSS